MKNIHILPTDKPSRLACDFDKLILNSKLLSPILYKTQNIYITSDEEIKEEDWLLNSNGVFKVKENFIHGNPSYKKIILTTDQDLIKDGVQAIPDEFLEWFVKTKYPIGGYAPGNYMCNCSTCKTQFQGDKRAVQCEPCAIKMIEQNIIDMMKGDEELGLYDEILPQQIWNEEKMEGIKQLIQDHKKETLEQAAERLFPNKMEEYDIFLMGAKWQKDQYTIEEQHIERSIGELEKEYIKGFNDGSKRQQDKICDSEVIQRIRASKSDAEARRIIRTI